MIQFTGKNPSWTAIWNCSAQCYQVYYKGQYMATKYKFSHLKVYSITN